MVKRKEDTADESDDDVVKRWKEDAPTRRSTKRGKYKTYGGVATKTEEEKKKSKAARMKKWKMAQKTKAAKQLVVKEKLEVAAIQKAIQKARKSKAS